MQATAKSKVLIVGTGNVGTWLLQKLHAVDNYELYVTNRSGRMPFPDNTYTFNSLQAHDNTHFDIVLLAVPDDAVHPTYLQWRSKSSYLVHFSGTLDLHNDQLWYGWPIYSIHAGIDPTTNSQIPLVIHADSPAILQHLFSKLSDHIHRLSVEQKITLHMCSVVANNFTNALLSEVQDLLSLEGLDMALLHPLIQQTFQQLLQGKNLYNLQTGPAVRQDYSTIARHVALLNKKDPIFKSVYESLSTLIIQKHLKKD
jgi:predicted short-subunit dehydrogenase-like oxidoreductase (DUF2520 family)